ncbi:PDR/VanB family oxidoreductase [Streptomyces sp. NPDC047081]|uniref:PDR/VanB family oxidoreductase n=1 Tax=Streptomyces sp. NPDC047081 TaxID=3154706 RepID=UPI0033E73B59
MAASPERRVLVRSMTLESEGVLSLELVDPAGAALPDWQPGAHVDLHMGGHVRQYSLCGSPRDTRRYRVAVLHEKDGRGGSDFVHTGLRPGDVIGMSGPRNAFPLVDSPRYVFVAGGIGITPILPMLAEAGARGRSWRLLYGGRRRASMAFLGELEPYGAQVAVRPEDEYGLLDLERELVPEPDTAVYCCGPEPLLRAVEARCAAWPASALRVERFAPREPTAEERAERAAHDGDFTVVLARSEREFEVPAGCSILEILEKNDVFPPSSCLEGTCGTCETTVLEGVADHRDSILDDEERSAGETMMICVSRSRSPRLVLDL